MKNVVFNLYIIQIILLWLKEFPKIDIFNNSVE
jgi:hypothetical protein